ncbi:MAG: ThiF family adenylyltransferase [Pirellulales bacterium]
MSCGPGSTRLSTSDRLGAVKLRLFDFDTVELINVTSQGYSQRDDVGVLKVEATHRALQAIEPAIRVEVVADRYRPELGASEAVFCCVDSISARKAIWRAVRDQCGFWCDGRMLGEVARILTATHTRGKTITPRRCSRRRRPRPVPAPAGPRSTARASPPD